MSRPALFFCTIHPHLRGFPYPGNRGSCCVLVVCALWVIASFLPRRTHTQRLTHTHTHTSTFNQPYTAAVSSIVIHRHTHTQTQRCISGYTVQRMDRNERGFIWDVGAGWWRCCQGQLISQHNSDPANARGLSNQWQYWYSWREWDNREKGVKDCICVCVCVCERESDAPLTLCFLCIAVYKCLCSSVFTKEPKLRQLSVFVCVCWWGEKSEKCVCVRVWFFFSAPHSPVCFLWPCARVCVAV